MGVSTVTDFDRSMMGRLVVLAAHARPLDKPFASLVVAGDGALSSIIGASQAFGTGVDGDPTRHCEMDSVRVAALYAHKHDFDPAQMTLYSTHEPCVMCAGAIGHAQIGRVVYGSCRENLSGLFRLKVFDAHSILAECRHDVTVIGGVLEDECIALFDGIERW